MIRFEAGPEEVAGLLKFLRKRAPQGRFLLARLPDSLDPSRVRYRPRVTLQPLLRDLEEHREARRWGVAFPTSTPPATLAEADFLVQFFFGLADTRGSREIILEVRDELEGDPPDLSNRSKLARALGIRAIRRLRRRGCQEGNHWVLPSD